MKATALYNGISGIKSFAEGMESVSDNLANTNTVGFKASRADFADTLSAQLATGDNMVDVTTDQVGTGSLVDMQIMMTQSSFESTDNGLDLAIDGGGFFTVQMPDDDALYYTRAGQFGIDGTEGQQGYIINQEGYRLQGFAVDDEGEPVLGALIDLQIPMDPLAADATNNAQVAVNLDPSDTKTNHVATDIDPSDADTYNYSTTMQMYDSEGNVHNMVVLYQQVDDYSGASPSGTTGVWKASVFESADGELTANPAAPNNTFYLNFTSSGALAGTTSSSGVVDTGGEAGFVFDFGTAGTQAVTVDFAPNDGETTTQMASGYENNDYDQDGYPEGTLAGVEIGDDGSITVTYDNNEAVVIGFVALSQFASPESLARLGSTLWAATDDSGVAQTGVPGNEDLAMGEVNSYALETSNVDMADEMTNMIWYQRAYQANSKSITTYDEILQKALSLKT